jgi:hypothetical protein
MTEADLTEHRRINWLTFYTHCEHKIVVLDALGLTDRTCTLNAKCLDCTPQDCIVWNTLSKARRQDD